MMEANVVATEFLGPTCRLVLECGPINVEADLPSESLGRDVSRDRQTLPLWLPASRIMVFRTDV
jgi:hypothetical protein